MPAKKPLALIVRHDTKKEIRERSERESAMVPTELLSVDVPHALEGERYKYAAKAWKRCVSLYLDLQSAIATPLDENLLVKYCKAEQQFIEMEKLRDEKINEWEVARGKANKIKLTGDAKQLKEWRQMWELINDMERVITVLDARLDAKGKYIHSMQQSLYLTPRSRAGVTPSKRKAEVIDVFEKFD
jgi:hypothetical protein